jgi:hypothetical protein
MAWKLYTEGKESTKHAEENRKAWREKASGGGDRHAGVFVAGIQGLSKALQWMPDKIART